jgi:menaquinone-9 beta-reductase
LTDRSRLAYIERMKLHAWDALVVGAGPAGSTAAFLLASQGLRVLVLDRSGFPRPKLCGGLLTWKTLDRLERIFGLTPQALRTCGLVHCTSRGYRVWGPGHRCLSGRLDDAFHFVDRERYDDHLRRMAIAAGAEFEPEAAITRVDPTRGEIASVRRRFTARFIVAADGVHSRMRSCLLRTGCLAPPRRPGFAAALECRAPAQDGLQVAPPELYYGYVPWGYAWSFPGSGHRLLGMAALKLKAGARIGRCFREFLGRVCPDHAGLRVHAHAIPYGDYLPRPGCANILLVGDAAGLADPFLGEGLYYAHRSAELAAGAVVACRNAPHRAAGLYALWCRREIHPVLRRIRAGRRLVFALPPRLYYPVLTGLLRLRPAFWERSIQRRQAAAVPFAEGAP